METRRIRISSGSVTPSLSGLLQALGWRTSQVAADEIEVELDLDQDVDAQVAQLRLAVVAWQTARPTVRASILEGVARPLHELRTS